VGSLGRDATRRPSPASERAVSAPTGATPQADPVLSRARAALAGGRYESPAGRNALDLYAAVLLARPGHPEALAGLDETIAHVVARADRAIVAGREAEAHRLLKRLQAVAPRSAAVTALARRLDPPPQKIGSPVTTVPPWAAAPAPAPSAATASRPPPATVLRPRPTASPPSPVLVAPPPLPTRMPAKAAATSPAVIAPDPLAPRIANAEEVRKQREFNERVRLAATRGPAVSSSGATGPPPPQHTTAGYETSTPVESAPATTVSPSVMAAGARVSPMSAKEFQPLHVTDPVYPPQALRNGVEGWVEVEFTITEQGLVRDVEVLGAEPRGVFESAAITAVGKWRFEPRIANGRPVAQRSVVTLRFNVDR
jgi:protein TonB